MQSNTRQRLKTGAALVVLVGMVIAAYSLVGASSIPQKSDEQSATHVTFTKTVVSVPSASKPISKPTWVDMKSDSWQRNSSEIPETTTTVESNIQENVAQRLQKRTTGLFASFGPATDGQVLTFIGGKISWENLPILHGAAGSFDTGDDTGGGRKPYQLSDGERHYGGGGGGGSSSSTTITNTTTVTGLSQSTADGLYVNVSGDSMDGALSITYNGLGLIVSGTASGNVLHAERLLTVTGSAIFDGNARFNSTMTLNGVTYSFPGSDGNGSGKVLKTNAAGQLSWSDDNTVGTGLSQNSGDERYVNQAGDTMTGALTINVTNGLSATLGLKVINAFSGAVVHAEKTLTSSGNLVWERAASGASLYVATSINGAGLTDCDAATQTLAWDATTGRFSCGTDSDTTYTAGQGFTTNGTNFSLSSAFSGTSLKIFGTLTGNILHAEKTLTSSGTFTVEGAMSGSSLYVATSINGAGLTDCDLSTQKLAWDSTTGRFSCGTDLNTGTTAAPSINSGSVFTLGDARYVKKQGDTMTGVLTINKTGAEVGLDVKQAGWFNSIHSTGSILSKGTLSGVNLIISGVSSHSGAAMFKSNVTVKGTLSGQTLQIANNASISGALLVKTGITSKGSVSGATINGFHLGSCNGASQKLLYNNSTQTFECGTDLNTGGTGTFGTGNVITIGDGRYVNTSGDTMTGALTINVTNGLSATLGLKVLNAFSGAVIHGEKTLTSSGTLTWEGAASGASLYVATSLNGAGLTDCDAATQTLAWDATTGRFSCGTDSDTTYTAGQGLTTNGTNFSLSSALSGTSLRLFGTLTGNILHAEKTLTSSGTLTIEGAMSGSSLYIATSINGAGLTDCDLSTQKLAWDSTTGRFSCGTDLNTGSTAPPSINSGSVFTLGNLHFVNVGGDTMTGALTINKTSAEVGLNVVQAGWFGSIHSTGSILSKGTLSGVNLIISGVSSHSGAAMFKSNVTIKGTLSGQTLQIANNASISGALLIKGNLATKSNLSGSALFGMGLGDCSNSTTSKLIYNNSTGKFSCASDIDTNTTYTAGQGLTTNGTNFSLSSALSGTSLRLFGTLTGNILHAEKTLTSSGTLTVEGAMSGSSLYVATSINGAGLTDCDLSTQKLAWDSTTGRFSCGTDLNTGSTAPPSINSGSVFTLGNPHFVNVGGDTMTGALTINVTNGLSATLGLKVLNAFSGSVIHAEKTLTSSGGLVWEGAASGSSLYVATSLRGAGLTDCTGGNKLLWDSSTGRFTCGVDQSAGTGLDQNSADVRYVNQSGDTMTGLLTINLAASAVGLDVKQAGWFNTIHSTGSILSKGTLSGVNLIISGVSSFSGASTFKNNLTVKGTLSGQTLQIANNASISGALLVKGNIATKATLSGASLIGFGLGDCSNATTSKLIYNNSTGKFSCATDTDTNTTYTAGQGLTTNGTNFSLSSALSGTSLRLFGTLTGNILHAEKTLTSSGTLTVEGAMSGSSLYVATSINGAGLTDCDAATQTLAWDATTGRFSCGTDSDTTYTAGQGLTTNGTNFSLSSALSGTSLRLFGTLTGNILHAEKTLTSSGTLTIEGAMSGASLYVATSINGAGLTDCDLSTQKLLWDSTTGRFSCGTDLNTGTTAAPSINSGSVFTLGDARFVKKQGDTMTGALTINKTGAEVGLDVKQAGWFNSIHSTGSILSKGTLSGENLIVSGVSSFSGIVVLKGNLLSKGTLSGQNLIISGVSSHSGAAMFKSNVTIKGTLSGQTLQIANNASISGALLIKGNLATKSNLSGSALFGMGLGDCSNSTTSKLIYNNSTGKFSCASDQTGSSGLSFTNAEGIYVNQGGDTMTGALNINVTGGGFATVGLKVVNTITGAIIHAEKNLTSSGNIVAAQDITAKRNLSGSSITVSRNGSISGSLTVKTSIVSQGSLSGSTFYGANLGDCNNSTTSKLIYNLATGKFGCATDQTGSAAPSINSGSVFTLGNLHFVNVGGDTMTGALVINKTSAAVGLDVKQAAWVNTLHATGSILSKGTISGSNLIVSGVSSFSGIVVLKGNLLSKGTLSGQNLIISGVSSFSGASTFKNNLTVKGTLSGQTLQIANNASISGAVIIKGNLATKATLSGASVYGFGLGDCSNSTTSKLIYNNSTGKFSCATDVDTDTNTSYTAGQGLTTNGTNFSLSSALSGTSLKIFGTLTGKILHAEKTLTSSGTLTVEGAMSGASLYVATSINGAGLTDCDAATQTLAWDATTGRFSCGTDSDTTYTAGQGLTTNGTNFSLSSALSGTSLRLFGTLTGNILHAEKNLTSSGTMVIVGNGNIRGTLSGNIIHAEKNLTSSGAIVAVGDILSRNGTAKTKGYVFFSGATLSEMSGFNEYLNIIHSGLGTNSVTRLTNQGDLVNIGTIQAGETHMRRGGTFATKVDYATGTTPQFVAIRDLNSDGKADLVVVNGASNSVSVFIGTGSGLFVAKVDYPTGSNPFSVAIGDLNGDGKPDLSVANYSSNSVSVFLNNGNGTFAGKVDYTTATSPHSVAIGDLNGDGKPDLAVANNASDSVSVFLNRGNGTFAAKVDYTTGNGPYAVAIGDLNGDGKADLVVTNAGSTYASVFLNNGDGTFASKVDYTTGFSNYAVAIGDLNGDGKADFAVTIHNSNIVYVFLNNGDGTFASKVDYTAGDTSSSIAIGDLNGDGKADLAVGNQASGVGTFVSILINNGNGTFATKVDYTTGTGPLVAIGDLNGDGKADLAVANSASDSVSVLLNISKTILFASSGTGGAVGIGTSTPGSALSVSGAVLINGYGNILNTKVDVGLALEVIGTMSGRVLHAQDVLRSSGSLIVEGTISGATLRGAGLASCNGSTQKLLYNNSTNKFECGTDLNTGGTSTFGSGNVINVVEGRYVNTSGDTMTGALTINVTNGLSATLGLKVLNAFSGAVVHAEKTLTSSGGLVWEGAASGSSLTLGTSLRGAGLTDCTGGNKLLWDSASGRFSCGVDQSAGSGLDQNSADARYVNQSGDTMTGLLTINLAASAVGLDVKQAGWFNSIHSTGSILSKGTLSGVNLIISGVSSFSGASTFKNNLTVKGTLSGQTLQIANNASISGALLIKGNLATKSNLSGSALFGMGLGDCSNSTTSKLIYNNSTGKFSCASDIDTNTTYSAGQGLTTNGTNFSLSSALSGTSLRLFGTLTGNILHAEKTLTSSGTLTIEGAMSGASLYVATSINGAGLTDCDAATQTLNWDSTTGRFSCGTDSDTTYTAGQGLTTNGTNFSLSSALSGTSLKLFGTLTGNILHAEKTLTSSGTLTIEGAMSGASLYVATSFSGVGLSDCDTAATSKLLWDVTTGRFSCGSDQTGGGSAPPSINSGSVFTLGNLHFVNVGGDTMTGALTINKTGAEVALDIKQAAWVNSLHSTGSILSKGNLSGETLIVSGNANVSGALLTKGNISTRGTISGAALNIMSGNSYFLGKLGIGKSTAPNTPLEIVGMGSGTSLFAMRALTSSGFLAVQQSIAIGSGAIVMEQKANNTGAYLMSSFTGSVHPLLALDSARRSFKAPAIMFGYRGSFDTSLQRTDTGTLALSGSMVIQNTLSIKVFGAATATTVCRTATGMLAACSSSLRFKEDVQDLSMGLSVLRQMRPVNFKWKGRDERDIGFIAEEVAAVDPMLATYNNAGQIEGVKYMQLTAVLTNAVKTLDTRLLGITNDSGTTLHARDLLVSSGALKVATFGTFGSGILLDTKYANGAENVFVIKSSVGGSGSKTVFRINASGSVFTTGTFNSQGADYAEWFKSSDRLKIGEVVCIDVDHDNTVLRCGRSADSNVMGIVSTRPAFIGNTIPGTEGLSREAMARKGYFLVGLIGQVPARATLEGGIIRSGDSLTSASEPGFVRRARAGESTVGVALETFDGSASLTTGGSTSSTSTINVLISRRNSSMTVDAVSQKVLDTIASMQIGDEVKRMVAASAQQFNLSGSLATAVASEIESLNLEGRISAAIEKHLSGATLPLTIIANPASGLSFASGGMLHAAALEVESGAMISGALRLNGSMITSNQFSLINSQVSMLSVSGSAIQIGSLMSSGSLTLIGPVTIEGLSTFLGDVEIKGELSVSAKQAGIALVPKGGTGVSVTFSGAFLGTPIVTATSDGFGSWRLRNRTQSGFTIELKEPANEDVTFTWLALSSRAPSMTTGVPATPSLIPFPVNSLGQPVSSDPIWNGCIQGHPPVDADGVPFSCARYHSDSVWDHPDLHISFIYSSSHDPAILTIPEGYQVTVVGGDTASSSSSQSDTPTDQNIPEISTDPIVVPQVIPIIETTDSGSSDASVTVNPESDETPPVPTESGVETGSALEE